MTEVATPTTAATFFHAAKNLMGDLWCRWQDEKEYEDIADYKLPVLPIAERCGVTILKMTKRPFGCHFKTELGTYELRITGTYASYKMLSRSVAN